METLDYDVDDGVATITFSRPERRNALDLQVFEELDQALDLADSDDQVRVVVLAAQGPVFCAGQNLKFTAEADDALKGKYLTANVTCRERIRKFRKPVVARIQGHVFGGGAYLVTACDLSVAVRGSRLALREVHSGSESGGAFLYAVGRARAMELSLLGRPIDAEEAERWGLINRCVDADDLDATVKDLTDQLVALPPLALQYTKSAQNLMLDAAGFGAEVEASVMWNRFLLETEDAAEARAAFAEKRQGKFVGR